MTLKDGRNIEDGNNSFNTHDTYTFKFSSRCLDLLNWQVKIGKYNINLENFWGTSSIRLIAYDEYNKPVLHDSEDDSNQVFCAQVQPLHERVVNS